MATALTNKLGTQVFTADTNGWQLMLSGATHSRQVFIQNRTNDAAGAPITDSFQVAFRAEGDAPGASDAGFLLLPVGQTTLSLNGVSEIGATTRLAVYQKRNTGVSAVASVTIGERLPG